MPSGTPLARLFVDGPRESAGSPTPRRQFYKGAALQDTTVKKIDSRHSPRGAMGELHLVSGKRVSMRLWREGPGAKPATTREYETVGYVISGIAELVVEGQTVRLEPGNSWLVPPDARHEYRILEAFEAIEATSPPAHVRGRDD
jgi:mannose-6-phosphate isomerase-like protein (cupin superfamily)